MWILCGTEASQSKSRIKGTSEKSPLGQLGHAYLVDSRSLITLHYSWPLSFQIAGPLCPPSSIVMQNTLIKIAYFKLSVCLVYYLSLLGRNRQNVEDDVCHSQYPKLHWWEGTILHSGILLPGMICVALCLCF